MILSEEQFRAVEERIIERETTWEDVENLLSALKFFIDESNLQSDALRAMLGHLGTHRFDTPALCVYEAMGSGAGVIRVKPKSDDSL
jgi:hypothetical protein